MMVILTFLLLVVGIATLVVTIALLKVTSSNKNQGNEDRSQLP